MLSSLLTVMKSLLTFGVTGVTVFSGYCLFMLSFMAHCWI